MLEDEIPTGVFPAYLRTGVAPSTLKSGGPEAVRTFAQNEDPISIWFVNNYHELRETLAALAGYNAQFNRSVRIALVPAIHLHRCGSVVCTPHAARPTEPLSVAERHHDLSSANLELLVQCFAPNSSPVGWTGSIKVALYAGVWKRWVVEDRLPSSYASRVKAHLQVAEDRKLLEPDRSE
jgi:hypothetical protein